MMKKLLVLATALALAAFVLAAGGCGGNTAQAKTDMKTADAAYAQVNKELTTLNDVLTTALAGAASGNFSKLTPPTVRVVSGTITKVLADLPTSRSDYQKLASLSGVPNYTEYANAMIKTIDLDKASLLGAQKLINALTPLVMADNTAAITQYFQANASVLNALQSQSTAISNAYSNAQAMKSSNKLGQ